MMENEYVKVLSTLKALQSQNRVLRDKKDAADDRLEAVQAAAREERVRNDTIIAERLRTEVAVLESLDQENLQLMRKIRHAEQMPKAMESPRMAMDGTSRRACSTPWCQRLPPSPSMCSKCRQADRPAIWSNAGLSVESIPLKRNGGQGWSMRRRSTISWCCRRTVACLLV